MAAPLVVGGRVRFTHPLPNGGTLTFAARIVRLNDDGSATVRIPDRVRAIPFPPANGAMFARYRPMAPTCSHCNRPGHDRAACPWLYGGPNVNAISTPDGV